ncbi:MAG: anti-sigma factor [Actinomycetota bacterium]
MSLLDRLFRRNSGLTCQQVEAVMQEYLDGELDPAMVPKVLEHLEACRDCGLEAEMYLKIKSSLKAHQDEPSVDSMDRIRAMAEELAANGPPPEESEPADV